MSQQFPVPLALVAAPDTAVRAAYALMLRNLAKTIECVEDGRDALVPTLRQAPDLIVAETQLRYISGYALCVELRHDAMTANLPVVIVSTGPISRAAEGALCSGATVVVTKPVNAAQLAEAVERVFLRSIELRQRGDRAITRAYGARRRSSTLFDQSSRAIDVLSHAFMRYATTVPPRTPPALRCQTCDEPLQYINSQIGGVSIKN